MPKKTTTSDSNKLDEIVANAHRNRSNREQDYREKSLKMYPWVCGRCSREFSRENLQELTVHHRDHNHDNNPDDGSNWELLCLYCHDNEHARYLDGESKGNTDTSGKDSASVTHNPLAGLAELLKKGD
ncbi:MAG: YajD family HNH nuclease [Gammaproteobacteria bacterium]|jgi:hypothetical protein|nr:YajD family HNH nuclease [Gammaproteobacteria bacterium]MDH3887021.1 YajD family HNH nuclease [Gammaproteobacteria bacterium]MDH3985243.1 YajD family HNH nuclease [Gammaproteobacteria bacterium]